MTDKELTFLDMIVETHKGLERQGPGSAEMTLKALSFVDGLSEATKAADLGCGCGGQTIVLAQNMPGEVVAIDELPEFIDVLNDNARKLGLEERVTGVVGRMENLTFPREGFDLIWSEGAIDCIGFEKGLAHWHSFLKKDGYIAVTCPSWLTDECPAEVEKLWTDAGSGMDTVARNTEILQECGYGFIASFTLPEDCWTDSYFSPRQAAEKSLLERHAGHKGVEEYVASAESEVELYSRYKQYYGYVFYIGRKM